MNNTLLATGTAYGLDTFAIPTALWTDCAVFNGFVHIGQQFHVCSVCVPHSLQKGILSQFFWEKLAFGSPRKKDVKSFLTRKTFAATFFVEGDAASGPEAAALTLRKSPQDIFR